MHFATCLFCNFLGDILKMAGFFVIIIIMIVVLLTIRSMAKNSATGSNVKKADILFPMSAKEMADEKNYIAKHASSSYIQNNNVAISKRIAVLTPSFKCEDFIEFAKKIFSTLTEDGGTARLEGVAGHDIDLTQLPKKIERYDFCFLHKLTVKENEDELKVLISVDNGESSYMERYFAVFTRSSSLKNTTKGGVIAVSCQSCGAALDFERRTIKTCPYCGNPVTYAEYDWVLTAVEHIDDDTVIDNRAVVEV